MMKGGDVKAAVTIKNWQKHTLSAPKDIILEKMPDILLDEVLIFTGTVVKAPPEKFAVGWHCRTTPAIDYDPLGGIVETRNTIYHLQGPPGDMFGDLGDEVLNISY